MKVWVVCVLCGLSVVSCGRKGPPLAPLVFLPATAGEFTVKRLGSNALLQFTIPTANSDGTTPVDLERVEVYAHTGALPTPADYVRYGTLIATIPVRDPRALAEEADNAAGASAAASSPISEPPLFDPGASVAMSETLTDAHKTPGPLPFTSTATSAPTAEALETEGTVNLPLPPVRYYTVVGVSRSRNRRGAFVPPLGVPLVDPPSTPERLQATYTETQTTLTWSSAGAGRFNVYEVQRDSAPSSSVQDARGATLAPGVTLTAPVKALNAAPLEKPEFVDPRVEFGTERCYVVRAIVWFMKDSAESPPSDPICVRPVDTFPPAAPRTLASVSSEKVVTLIWEPNAEKDLGGYRVLRGEGPDATLAPLTASPIQETTYRDDTVQVGRTYTYAVEAVDTAAPPNVSEPSNRVTETIR